jgi:hypothetical protein
MNLPALASHYQDGSRDDHRTAGRYIAEHWQPGDRVAAVSPALLRYYAQVCQDIVPISYSDPVPAIRVLGDAPRLWLVVCSNRAGKSAALRQLLSTHFKQELEVRRRRFDYYDFTIEVYLRQPPDTADAPSQPPKNP